MIGRPLKEEGIYTPYSKKAGCVRDFRFLSGRNYSDLGLEWEVKKLYQRSCRGCPGADLLIGARRMVQSCVGRGQDVYVEYDSEKIGNYIRLHPEYEKIAIVLSGDTGFYSGARKLAGIWEIR